MLPSPALPSALNGAATIEATPQPNTKSAGNRDFGAILARSKPAEPATDAEQPAALATALAAAAIDSLLPEDGKDLPDAPDTATDPALLGGASTLVPLPPMVGIPLAPLQPASPRSPSAAQLPAVPGVVLSAGDAPQPQPQLKSLASGVGLPATQPLALPPEPLAIPAANLLHEGAPHGQLPRVAGTLRLLMEPAADKTRFASPEVGSAPLEPAATTPTFGLPPVSAAAPSQTLAAAQPTAQGPQDFAALIDRLAAARESAAPQAATLALAHAEFGQVELRFASDGAGLSVAMASADPDFARAVQAAVPPVIATNDSTGAQGRQSGQPDPGGNFTGRHNGQSPQQQGSQQRAPLRADSSRRDAGAAAGIFA